MSSMNKSLGTLAFAEAMRRIFITLARETVDWASCSLDEDFGMPEFLDDLITDVTDKVASRLTPDVRLGLTVEGQLWELLKPQLCILSVDMGKAIAAVAKDHVALTRQPTDVDWIDAFVLALDRGAPELARRAGELRFFGVRVRGNQVDAISDTLDVIGGVLRRTASASVDTARGFWQRP